MLSENIEEAENLNFGNISTNFEIGFLTITYKDYSIIDLSLVLQF